MENIIKIFYLIVHYEKVNIDLVSYLSRSLHRNLSTKQHLYKFESVLLKFLGRDIFKISSLKEKNEQFRQLRKALVPLEKDSYEKSAFREFDFIAWVESKIENKSFAEVVREKADKYA